MTINKGEDNIIAFTTSSPIEIENIVTSTLCKNNNTTDVNIQYQICKDLLYVYINPKCEMETGIYSLTIFVDEVPILKKNILIE